MKLALALLLLCGAAAVLAAPGDAPAGGVAGPMGDLSNQMSDLSRKVGQVSNGMGSAATQLKKLGEVHSMLTAEAERRKLQWRAKFGVKEGQGSESGNSEDKFGEWKQKNFPENGAAPAETPTDPKAELASDAVDAKMLKDVLEKAKDVSPLADSVNESLKSDLASMAASLGNYNQQVKKASKKLDASVLTAKRRAEKEAAIEKLQTAMSQSRARIRDLHQRAKQLSSTERMHKRNLKRKLKTLASMHRKHIKKLIYSSRLQAIKLWLQNKRRKKLAQVMNDLKVAQMYQNHKKETQQAMSKSAKALWSSFIKALQGHKGLKDEQRKAESSIRRLHQRRMNKLKQDHQRKKQQIKKYVQQKYAAIMKAHFDRINRIRRQRQATLKALNQEMLVNRQQQRRMERIVTDQESPSSIPDYERAFREKAARTRRLQKLYRAIKEHKSTMKLRAKTQQRLTQIQDKVGQYYDDLRTKLQAKIEKLDEVISANQQKIDEAIEKERQRWKARMATRHLKKRVAELSETITQLKTGTLQDLPDDVRQALEREAAAKHHASLRRARRAARIAAQNDLQTTSFIEEEPLEENTPSEPMAVTTDVEGSDENALVAGDDATASQMVTEEDDSFASELPGLMRELKSMRRMKARLSAATGGSGSKPTSGTKKGGKAGKGTKGGKKKGKKKKGKKKGKKKKGKKRKNRRRRRNRGKKKKGKKKSKKSKKGGKNKGGKTGGKTGGSSPTTPRLAATEESATEEEEVEEQPATENSESVTEEEAAPASEAQAVSAVTSPSADDKGDKGSKGTKTTKLSEAEAAATAALAEASETDEDVMKDLPAEVSQQ